MILLALISVLAVRARSSPITAEKSNRSSKFMRFGTPDELFSEVLDDIQDPFFEAEEIGFGHISDKLRNTTRLQTSERDPIRKNEKVSFQNTKDKGKYELISSTSGHIALPTRPTAENEVVFYGGQHYKYRKPDSDKKNGNRTGEIKIFWSSVTDAIENLPFIPVQVNVPDMIGAMANFLSTSLPIINRFTNPNQPRLPIKLPEPAYSDQYYPYDSNSVYDNTAEDRELKDTGKTGKKGNKRRKGNKRKGSKPKKGSLKGLPQRPFFRRTTESAPTGNSKIWHAVGSGSPTGTSLKNMPISRKKITVRDREVFNFKNSDISNSPIMILNLPERPMMYYKTRVDQKIGNSRYVGERPDSTTTTKPEVDKTRVKNAPKVKRNPVKTKGNKQ